MLGWEYPPEITGGLGTACEGLTRALTRAGIDVLFVAPRTSARSESEHLELLGCDQVPIPRRRLRYRPRSASPSAANESIEWLGVPSSLRPYQTARSYHQHLRELAEAKRNWPEPKVEAYWEESGPGSPHAFLGGYGPTLFQEVERYARAVCEIAARRDFDVIHAHDWMTFPAALRVAERTGKPLVCHVHASEFDRRGAHADPRVGAIERLALAHADRVVAVSHYTADLVSRRYEIDPAKIAVVHNAIDPERTRSSSSRKPVSGPLVLFLGRMTSQKGPSYFLEAASQVAAARHDVHFAICGAGDELAATIEGAARLGIARRVSFTGALDREHVARMYAMADLYVMPSVSEPFGLTSLEAMAADVPVIVSRQSGAAEVLRHSLKVDFWDTVDLANKILGVLRFPALYRQLVEEGREEVGQLRWETSAASVAGLYEELAA